MTWLSLFSCTLAFIVVCLESRRIRDAQDKFPQNLGLIFSRVALGFNGCMLVGPFMDFQQVTEFHNEDNEMFHNICIGQAFFWQFFAAASIFWYVAFTNMMYNIIVRNVRLKTLERRKNRAYFLGFILPFISALVPLIAGAYGPRYTLGERDGLECWLEDPTWQLVCILIWVVLGLFWGTYRGYWIVVTLRKTKFKTQRSREKGGAMKNKKGYKLVQTLKENYRKNLFLLVIYALFTIIIVVYYVWTTILSRYDQKQDVDDPCLASVAYSADISLLGTCIFGLFGVTYHNLRMTRDFFRAIKEEIYYIFCWSEGDDDVSTVDKSEGELQLTISSGGVGGEAPALPPPPPPNGKRAPLAEHDGGPVPGGQDTITTHIGTRINARLGVIKAQLNNGAMPSAYEPNAVSGSSMPPKNHPVAPKLKQQRDEYTRKVLEYATQRVKNMPGIEKSFLESFMSEIEVDSRWTEEEDLEGEEGEGEDEFCSEIYDSAMSVEDLDARLKRAKAKFEEALQKQESRGSQV
ncbi:hypothetical protein TrVE_jg12115 [Triparma verrucosa]|uniref:G-protein coupled receptors family 2 profile 2 domain-containing protein n=1 Tax=Triparma verrucosa TaxID=1606542 RepID=A0A9W7F4W9_9STRA|nr:hypothetical protein TrVE_jg12115 [Triparma verrucosa]